MEVSEYFTINLRLGKRIFPITIKRTDEEIYRTAEKLVNERLGYYAEKYINQEEDTYLCMTALDLAVTVKKNEFRNDTEPFVEAMQRMLDNLNKTLRPHDDEESDNGDNGDDEEEKAE